MKYTFYLILFILIIQTELNPGCQGRSPGSVTPVINGKTKMAVLIPGRDSIQLTVTNTTVANWTIQQAPDAGIVTLTGADGRQVWVRVEVPNGQYGIDTLTIRASDAGGNYADRNIYVTRYDNYYQYHGEVLLDKIKLEFYNGQSGLYAESIRSNGTHLQGTSYLWPASHLMRAFKNANRINPTKYGNTLKNYCNAIDRYKSTSGNKVGYAAYPGESGRFYDDNGLLIIQFGEIYNDLSEAKILDQAKIAYHFNHNDRDAFWGLPQHENQRGQGMFYSMAVNQTGLGAAILYELTGEANYLNEAKSYYTQLMNPQVKLRDSYYHLFHQYTFYQNGQWSYAGILDGQSVNGQGFRAYQTTHVIQLGLKLYKATGESKYLADARDMMNASINFWYTKNQGLNENSFWGGDDMIDALIDFYETTSEIRYFEIARDIIDFLITHGKDAKGYYPGDYDDNNGKWNLDRTGEAPPTYLLMGQAAAAAGILRVADIQSGLGTGIDDPALVNGLLQYHRVFPTWVRAGEKLKIQLSQPAVNDLHMEIYTADGRLLGSEFIQANGLIAESGCLVQDQSEGMLIIRISDGLHTSSHRIFCSAVR